MPDEEDTTAGAPQDDGITADASTATDTDPAESPVAGLLPRVAREVEEFVAAAGWEQPPQLFALVSTSNLLQQQPELAVQLDPDVPLTPIAQEQLPADDLAEALAGIGWPDTVEGCAVTQEIVVLPPDAEAELAAEQESPEESERIRRLAAEHPQRREARLVAAVRRDGVVACVLRLRGTPEEPEQIVEHPELAPNLTEALLATLRP